MDVTCHLGTLIYVVSHVIISFGSAVITHDIGLVRNTIIITPDHYTRGANEYSRYAIRTYYTIRYVHCITCACTARWQPIIITLIRFILYTSLLKYINYVHIHGRAHYNVKHDLVNFTIRNA